jgi:hydroxymethylbilane synthase
VRNDLVAALNHEETSVCVRAERALLKRLEGGCQVPIAAHASLIDGKLIMDGLVGSVSGDRIVRGHIEGSAGDAESLGIALADEILAKGAREILDEVYGKCAPSVDGEISS